MRVVQFFILIGFIAIGALPVMADSWTQTDWSGGPGQNIWLDATKYQSDDGHVDATSSPGSVKIEGIPWYGANWSKRRPITITNSGSALSNYQVKVIITYDSDMQLDFDDIRFTNSDMTTELSYWCGSYVASDSAIFWVKVPSIPSGASTIYVYYGNPAASTASNGDATFEWFDDFSSNTSSEYDIGRHADDWMIGYAYYPYYSSANERVEYDTDDNNTGGWKPTSLSIQDFCAKVTMGVTGFYPNHTTNGILGRWQDNNTFYGIKTAGGSYGCIPGLIENSRSTEIACPGSNTYHPMDGTPFTLQLRVWGNNIKGIYNEGEADEVVLSTTDASIPGPGQIDIIVAQATGWFDDFIVRKYTEPEPTTSVGSEEAQGWTEAYLVSSVYDASTFNEGWDTMTWNDVGVQTIKFKVKTSNDSTMAGATDWSSCDYVMKDQDISSINSVTDGHRYIQYRVELSTLSLSETPVLNDVTINYTTSADSWTQTDWSGGSGQNAWSDTTKYQSDDGHVDVASSPGSVKLSGSSSSISEPSFETVNDWTYYENEWDFNGGRSADWSTDGTYSYKFWSTGSISRYTYCQISQLVNFTDLSTIYFDCKLWAEQNNVFEAYVLIDDAVVWQKAITTTTTEYLDESIDVNAYTSDHYLRFRIKNIYWNTSTFADQTNYFENIRTSPSGYNSSGTLTSSIYDADSSSKEWGTMTWGDAGVQTVKFKVRTSDDPNMSGANDWSSCDYVTKDQDISSINSVNDTERYIQYRTELSTTNSSETPILNSVAINYAYHPDIAVSPNSFAITLCADGTKDTTLVISNIKGPKLIWSLSESPSVDWLSENPISDTIYAGYQADVNIHFDVTGLSAGTYNDTLVITSNDPDEPTINIPVQVTVQAPPSDWGYKKLITIDHTKVKATLTDFPVLISLTDADLKDTDNGGPVQPDGDDIMFTLTNCTKLSHEIELYTGSTGKLVAWVKIPTLSHTTDIEIYMYYGNSTCESQQDVTGVWDSNFIMVQHLDETAGTHYDATANDNDGTPQGGVTQDTTGKIDGADDFDRNDDYVSVNNSSSLQLNTALTITAWIKGDSWDADMYVNVIARKGEGNPNNYQFAIDESKATLFLDDGDDGGIHGSTTLSTGIWYYVAATWNGSTTAIYLNGDPDGSSGTYRTSPIGTDTRALYIGGRSGITDLFDGLIDEVRISNSARSADWIKTSYNNQSNPATFMSFSNQTADITVSPDSFSLTSCLCDTKDTALVISNTGNWILSWDLLENPSVDWLSEDTTNGSTNPSAENSVSLHFDATSLSPGTYNDTLVITSNDPDESTVKVPVQLTVNAADISVSPDSFDLTIYVDSTKDTTLVISNVGNCDLIWSLVENPSVDWLSENPTSDSVNPSSQTNVMISFNATGLSPGIYNDTLVITSNDTDEPTINMPVKLTVISSGYDISGYVKYWTDSTPAGNVKMVLSGGASDTVLTDSMGYYIFSDLQSGLDYIVTPVKTDTSKDTTITAYDASLILNHAVELDTLDENQQKAADASGNGTVSPYDAGLILRYVVDKIVHFPAGDWAFTPDSINYISLSSNQSNQNYTTILYGDTSGNGSGSKGVTLRTRFLYGGAFEKQKSKRGGVR
jgi:hypothetical protein